MALRFVPEEGWSSSRSLATPTADVQFRPVGLGRPYVSQRPVSVTAVTRAVELDGRSQSEAVTRSLQGEGESRPGAVTALNQAQLAFSSV